MHDIILDQIKIRKLVLDQIKQLRPSPVPAPHIPSGGGRQVRGQKNKK